MRVVTAGPRMALYAKGRRRTLPPLRFGLGVLVHLRHGRSTTSCRGRRFRTSRCSRRAARRRAPLPHRRRVGARCLHVPERAFCFSRLQRTGFGPGPSRRVDPPREAVRRLARAANAGAGAAGGRARSSPHPGEERTRARPRRRAGARAAPRPARRDLRRRSLSECGAPGDRGARARRPGQRPRLRRRRGARRRAQHGAQSRAAVEPRGLRARGDRVVRPRRSGRVRCR